MAYFSNATEGLDYEDRWCSSCVHNESCTVMMLHLDRNYDQMDKGAEDVREILEVLIPTDDDHFAGKCTMYFKSAETANKQTNTRVVGIEFASHEK